MSPEAGQPSVAAPTTERVSLPWVLIAWVSALLVFSYYPVLVRLVAQWNDDGDMGHGFFVPVIAGYIVWQRRSELLAVDAKTNWWGLAVVIWGGLQLYIATVGSELFLARTAFVFSVIGAVMLLGGTKYLKICAFPLFLLFFMVPIPAVLYNQITFPLQLLASNVAEHAILWLQIPVIRRGNILELPDQTLNVVEACSGIRSLLTLTFISLVYGYFFERKTWIRVALFFSTIPIAIAANAGRVTLTGVVSTVNKELSEGFAHEAQGWVIFIIAFMILIGLHQVFARLGKVFDHGSTAAN